MIHYTNSRSAIHGRPRTKQTNTDLLLLLVCCHKGRSDWIRGVLAPCEVEQVAAEGQQEQSLYHELKLTISKGPKTQVISKDS
jgi:hypothetical protein